MASSSCITSPSSFSPGTEDTVIKHQAKKKMARPFFPDMEVRRREAPVHPNQDWINMLKFQSALIRGDRQVTLDNADDLTPNMLRRIGVMFPSGHPQYEPWIWNFTEYHDPDSCDHEERPAVRRVLPKQPWEGFRLEWIKVIGEGGFGLATLWKVTYADGSTEKVVIKIPKGADITGEAAWHLRYKGAEHIVQLVDIQQRARDICEQQGLDPRLAMPGQKFDWEERKVVVLEYAEFGNLYEMMSKATFFETRFPTRCLWEIWECLVKGVASTAYQPFIAQDAEKEHLLDETLEAFGKPDMDRYEEFLLEFPLTHDVHFDLEEQNILLAAYSASHDHGPLFKLHDFGEFSHKMRRRWDTWVERDYWFWRKAPKKNRIPPESFVAAWDDLDPAGGVDSFKGADLSRGHPTAGRYGTWTNIFFIGQIMEGIITHKYGSHPMRPQPYRNLSHSKTESSYGWRLLSQQYRHIDVDLIDLIMQCQYERPADRPSIDHLLRKIAQRKAAGFAESADQVRQFWEEFAQLRRGSEYTSSDEADGDIDGDTYVDAEGDEPMGEANGIAGARFWDDFMRSPQGPLNAHAAPVEEAASSSREFFDVVGDGSGTGERRESKGKGRADEVVPRSGDGNRGVGGLAAGAQRPARRRRAATGLPSNGRERETKRRLSGDSERDDESAGRSSKRQRTDRPSGGSDLSRRRGQLERIDPDRNMGSTY